MTDQQKIDAGKGSPVTKPKTGLELLREPFKPNAISKLPKPTKRQTEEVRNDFKKGIRCKECGAWHHPQVVHLDYVGHAALTDRLLDCDPNWNWEPVSFAEDGTPKLDQFGGMWIKLTVCDQTRLGYGHADGKSGGDAIKEVIGDALRNAAMRFGAALDLWHKGDLHGEPEEPAVSDDSQEEAPQEDKNAAFEREVQSTVRAIENESDFASLGDFWADLSKRAKSVALDPRCITAKDKRKAELTKPKADADLVDEIPY